jgi:hypothetical protein
VRGDKKVAFAARIQEGAVRSALRKLENEYFTIRYKHVEQEKEIDFIRVTGARLLLGTYYFVEYGDRLLVVRRDE